MIKGEPPLYGETGAASFHQWSTLCVSFFCGCTRPSESKLNQGDSYTSQSGFQIRVVWHLYRCVRPTDFLTLLQLSVGLNWVVGAYGSYRRTYEDDIRDRLDHAREHMDALLLGDRASQPSIPQDLQVRNIKDLSNRELNRYLIDANTRFHRRRALYRHRDGYLEPLLLPIGLISLIGLVYASFYPHQTISHWAAFVACGIAFLPSVAALTRLAWEVRQHENFYRREPNPSYVRSSQESQNERMRSKPTRGEISRIINQVRIRHREKRDGAGP